MLKIIDFEMLKMLKIMDFAKFAAHPASCEKNGASIQKYEPVEFLFRRSSPRLSIQFFCTFSIFSIFNRRMFWKSQTYAL